MKANTKIILEVITIAVGTFSVAVLAQQAGAKLTSNDPKTRKAGLICAGAGVIISGVIITRLNLKHIKEKHQ